MKLKEALIALADGKKVRKESWPKNQYIMLHDNRILDYNNDPFYIDNKQRESWELYPEYDMNFPEALSWMMQAQGNICEADDSMFYVIGENKSLSSGNKIPYFGRHVLHGEWFENKNDVDMLLSMKFKKVEE